MKKLSLTLSITTLLLTACVEQGSTKKSSSGIESTTISTGSGDTTGGSSSTTGDVITGDTGTPSETPWWSSWSNWSACSQSCNSGTQERTRTCQNSSGVQPASACGGNNTEQQTCNPQACYQTIAEQAQDIAIGYAHGCFITKTSQLVKCWGDNTYGQLGQGNTTAKTGTVSVAVPTSNLIVKIAAGKHHTCAMDSAGDVFCWGLNTNKQSNGSSSPNKVTTVTSKDNAFFALGDTFSCVSDLVGTDLTLRCWGYAPSINSSLNNSTVISWVHLGGTKKVTSMAGGRNIICFARVYQEGNTYYQAGHCRGSLNNNTTYSGLASTNLSYFNSVSAAGDNFGCHIFKETGKSDKIFCSGSYDKFSGTTVGVTDLSFSGVLSVHGGRDHACFLYKQKNAECWGKNTSGKINSSTSTGYSYFDRTSAVCDSSASYSFDKLALGERTTCGIQTTINQIVCWGAQLTQYVVGSGTDTQSSSSSSSSAMSL